MDLAQTALVWLAGQPDEVGDFLSASGADPEDLREGMKDPVFLGFVLDYILGSDNRVIRFAADTGTPPDRPARARAALPGGDQLHWT